MHQKNVRKAAADALIIYFRHGIQPEDVQRVEDTSVLASNRTEEEGISS